MTNIFYNNKEKTGSYCTQEKTNSIFECVFCAEVCETGIIYRNQPQARIHDEEDYSLVQPPLRGGGYNLDQGNYHAEYPSYGHVTPPILRLEIEEMPSLTFCNDCEENVGAYSGWYDGIYWNFSLCTPEKRQSGCNIFTARASLGFYSGEPFNYNEGAERNVYLFLGLFAKSFTLEGNTSPTLKRYEESSNSETSYTELIGVKAAIVGTMKYTHGETNDSIPQFTFLGNDSNEVIRSGFYDSTVFCTGWNNLELDLVKLDIGWGCDISNSVFKISSVNEVDYNLIPYLGGGLYKNLWRGCSALPYSSTPTNNFNPSGTESIIFRENVDNLQYRSTSLPLNQEIQLNNGSGNFWSDISGVNTLHYWPFKQNLTNSYEHVNFNLGPYGSKTQQFPTEYPIKYLKIIQDYSYPNENQIIDGLSCDEFRSPVAASSQLDIRCLSLSLFNSNSVGISGHAIFDIISTYGFINNQVLPTDQALSTLTTTTPLFYGSIDKYSWLIARYSGNYDIDDLGGSNYFYFDLSLNPIYINNDRLNDRLFLDESSITINSKSTVNNLFKPCLEKNTFTGCNGGQLPDYLEVDFSNLILGDGFINTTDQFGGLGSFKGSYYNNDHPVLYFGRYSGFHSSYANVPKWSYSPFTWANSDNPFLTLNAIPLMLSCSGCWEKVSCGSLPNNKPTGSYVLNKALLMRSDSDKNYFGLSNCSPDVNCNGLVSSGNFEDNLLYSYENPDYSNLCDWKYLLCKINSQSSSANGAYPNVLLYIVYPKVSDDINCYNPFNNTCQEQFWFDLAFSGEFPLVGDFNNLGTSELTQGGIWFQKSDLSFEYRDCSESINLYGPYISRHNYNDYAFQSVFPSIGTLSALYPHSGTIPLCESGNFIHAVDFYLPFGPYSPPPTEYHVPYKCGYRVTSINHDITNYDRLNMVCDNANKDIHPVYSGGYITLTPFYS